MVKREERYARNVYEIRRICSILKVNDYVLEEVERLYYKALCMGETRGKELLIYIASLVYYVSRREGYVIPLKEISERLGINNKRLYKQYRRTKKELGLTVKNYDYSSLIERYNNKINYEFKYLSEVYKVYEKIKHYQKDPRVKIATAFYFVSRKNELELSMKKIAELTGTSPTPIQVLFNKIMTLPEG